MGPGHPCLGSIRLLRVVVNPGDVLIVFPFVVAIIVLQILRAHILNIKLNLLGIILRNVFLRYHVRCLLLIDLV